MCKDFKSHRCLILKTEFKKDVAAARKLNLDLGNRCFFSSSKPHPGKGRNITVIYTHILFIGTCFGSFQI